MVTTARVPADGTWSNLLRQWATSATTVSGKGGKRSAKVTPTHSWQPPVSSDSSRCALDDARWLPSPPPWSGRVVTGHEFGQPGRNCGVTSGPVVASRQTTAASRGYRGTTVEWQGGSRKWRIWAERGNTRDDTARRLTASCQGAISDTTVNRQGGNQKWRIWAKNGKSVTEGS